MTERTAHYGLALPGREEERAWEALNENWDKVDAALAGKAEGAVVAALQSWIVGKAEVIFGTYAGNGSENRTISLGFRPKGVFLMVNTGWIDTNGNAYGGLAADGISATGITVVDTGFMVTNNNSLAARTNTNGMVYNYMAFR